jgi:hypothetical protein
MARSFPLVCLLALSVHASAQVIINEIHYNPVERPAFNSTGVPVFQGTNTPADFTDDVHEFLEFHNPSAAAVNLGGWRLDGGIDYTFPAGTTIAAGGYLVVARNPARIEAVYGITGVLGPFANDSKLGNSGDDVRLLTPTNVIVDAVTYSDRFPWAISADRLGAGDDWTLLNSANYQYKGRSLQRVSPTAASNHPANWVAARLAGPGVTFADLPTPGATNIVTRAVPKPVVVNFSATQLTTGATLIRANQIVRLLATFSGEVTNPQVEYFVENVNSFIEPRTTVAMTPLGNNQYEAQLPGRSDRNIVRYRFLADRGDGAELVSPRQDDPAIVPTGLTAREAWHSYFVTPTRTSLKPIYDCFVSTNNQPLSDNLGENNFPFTGANGLQAMAYHSTGNIRRITASSITTNAFPRDLPFVAATDRLWNGTVPAIFIENGNVRDAQLRFHGSRYNRRPSRKSYKLLFPDYQMYQKADSLFITDKNDFFSTAHGLHLRAGLPLSHVRYVDWYLNGDGLQVRLEQGEYNGDLLDQYHETVQRLNPGSAKEETGELYKSVGVIVGSQTAGEGPYGAGNGWLLPAVPAPSGQWTDLQRYDFTYGLQNHAWKGSKPIKDLLTSLWAARGDSVGAPNPNITALRAWFNANWDVDTELTSLALGNWMTPWDDTTQNYFLWRRASGKWVRLLWDFDNMYGRGDKTSATSSIYLGEVGLPDAQDFNNSRGPNYIKDSFIKAFRNEYKERLWFLNNTLLDPENLQTLTYQTSSGGLNSYRAYIDSLNSSAPFTTGRWSSVNSQVGLGIFYKPRRPSLLGPSNAAQVLPGTSFTTSAYVYDATLTHSAAPVVSPHASTKWEIRSSTGTYDDPAFVLTSTTNLTSLPIPFDQLTFGQTYFWRATYFSANGRPSITSSEISFVYGSPSPGAGNVTINEIMADNSTAVLNGLDRPDYVELRNNTAAAVDLSGWFLTDDEQQPTRYAFPAGTTIAANGYLVVWCDTNNASPGLHSGFGLSRRGQRVILLQGNIIRDAIAFGPQPVNTAIGRFSDGVGSWTMVNASPGETNTARTFSTNTSTLKINEWMALPASGSDWFEIYNSGAAPVALAGLWLSDDPAVPKTTQIPALSFVAAGGCVRFDADGTTSGFSSVNFRLSTAADQIVLTAADGATLIDTVSFGPQEAGVSQGRFPDGTGAVISFTTTASPGDNNWLPAPVRVNEVLSSSVAPQVDFVEIYNPTASAVDISNWWLSDDSLARQKYRLPAGSIVPAQGFLVFTEAQFNLGAAAFAFSSTGDEVVLSAANGDGTPTGYRSQRAFGGAAEDVSFGYIQTGSTPEFWPQVTRTQESANAAPVIGPVIINEVHYRPPDIGTADNARDEFVELHNISTTPVDLSGWRLSGQSDFTFAPGTELRPGDYILVVSFNPVTDPSSLATFRSVMGVSSSVRIYGPYAPKLPNDSNRVELGYPSSTAASFIMMDRIEYTDFAPWPTSADGGGMSLQRISRLSIGNDVANWNALAPTPGGINPGQPAILDNDGDGLTNAWEDANGTDKFLADTHLDLDGDGLSNGGEFAAGTNPQNPNDTLRASVAGAPAGTGFVISFAAKAGKTYTIEYKNQLSDATWTKLVDVPAPVADQQVQHTDSIGLPNRFYRVATPARP